MQQGIDGLWDGEPRQEWVRDTDGVVEHCVFDIQMDGTVVMSVQVLSEILMALGFHRVDMVHGEVVASSDEQTVSSTESTAVGNPD